MVVTKDLMSSVMFILLGAATVIIGSGYPFGTTMQMGPGFFPVVAGSACAIVGAFIGVNSLLNPQDSEPVTGIAWKPLILLPAAIVAFGMLIQFGLIPAVAGLAVIARLAGPKTSLVELLVLSAILTAIAVLIFVIGLRMPIAIWR